MELRRIAGANPFLAIGADPKLLHVAFLAAAPGRDAVARLDRARSPPDALEARGSEVYLSLANGVGRSRLTND